MPKKQEELSVKPQNIKPIELVKEMETSYLQYAMSVIVSRALPDVRDGLKPVHRRILYAMWGIGLKHNARFRKSAHVVGEVMAKYHPHGDSAIYDSMVRMAQDFSMRYQLVNGQGNFGSLDGDSAAAMRYTEAKLQAIAEELLFDIEKDTVDFKATYDGSHREPRVLPAKLPNLLLTGSMGIAVGMATNIPPHNLTELCDGITHLIENSNATIEDLNKIIKGPDFPTGGIIYDKKDIAVAYATGKGGVVMRAKIDTEEKKPGYHQIIVREIPYQVNKSRLIEKIANLVQEKKMTDIKDLRDESNKDGIRIVIELKRDAFPKKVLNKLYKLTDLQTKFHFNMLALVDGIQPRILNLKTILEEHIKHRQVVVVRRAEFELAKARARAHILEGLKKALDKIDEVIKIIKKSKNKEEAKQNLMAKFKFSELQTIAILDMRLQQLANLERQKIENELKEKMVIIKKLEGILNSPKKILGIIKTEISEIKEKFGDTRRTKIVAHGVKEFRIEDLIPNEPTLIIATRDGYIKRLDPNSFKTQGRGGKGVIGLATKEEDVVEHLISTYTHDRLLLFTSKGQVFQLYAHEIPQTTRTSRGNALVNFLQLSPRDKVTSILSMDDINKYKFLIMTTTKGTSKKTKIKDFETVRKSGLIAIKLKDGDRLEWVRPSSGKDDVAIVTKKGQAIRFKEKDLRPMGRAAAGVRGIRLKTDDEVVGMNVVTLESIEQSDALLLVVSELGRGKKTALKYYKVQKRGGSGIKTMAITQRTGQIVKAKVLRKSAKDDLLIITVKGQIIRIPLKSVSTLGRATQGVRIMKFKAVGDKVVSLALLEKANPKENLALPLVKKEGTKK
ncbi:MAG: DNA gyrase subunit A [Candidatus Magasanikbacteria bacterium]|nr:DNA gyrase subunit A [Candidatus Magasanikbacteria bacterium]